jgi:hypothetical protein
MQEYKCESLNLDFLAIQIEFDYNKEIWIVELKAGKQRFDNEYTLNIAYQTTEFEKDQLIKYLDKQNTENEFVMASLMNEIMHFDEYQLINSDYKQLEDNLKDALATINII